MIKVLGDRLKEVRVERGLTQRQVAEALGVAQNSIAGYETGARVPSIDVLIKFCKFYQVSADYLLGLSDF